MHINLRVLLLVVMAISLCCWVLAYRPRDRYGRAVGLLLLLAFGVEVICFELARRGVNTTAIYNSYLVLEFGLLLGLVGLGRPDRRGALVLSGGAGLTGVVYGLLRYRSLDFLLTEGIISMCLVVTGWSLVVLWDLARTSDEVLWRLPRFWLFMGMLIYFGGMVPFMGMLRFLYTEDPQLSRLLYQIITFVALLKYLFASWAALRARQQRGWAEHAR